MTGPASPETVAGATWSWLCSQLGTGTVVTTRSTIVPDQDYPAAWTGPVAGRASLDGVDVPLHALQVVAVVVTDRSYPIATTALAADGSFALPDSRPGAKVFRLVDPSGRVLAEHAPATGLMRSFQVAEQHALAGRTFCYDQALAVLTALSLGDLPRAEPLATGLLRMQTDGGAQDGGFVTSAAALHPEGGSPEYRTGNCAIATYALLRYLRGVDPGRPAWAAVLAGARRGVDWLLAQQVGGGPLDGLVRGGFGADVGLGFEPGHALEWASTEHNLDAWHTLRLAARVLDDPAAGAAALRLEAAILARLWSRDEKRFWQGRSPAGPDRDHALDVSSWGAIFLAASGRRSWAVTSLANVARFASSGGGAAGYAPVPAPRPPLVWVEGTAGVALAQLHAGRPEEAQATMRAIAPLGAAGVWPGATREDTGLSMTTAPAVGAATWVLLVERARAGRPSIWDDENEEQR